MILKFVPQNQRMSSWWWGVAYIEYERNGYWVAPFPLNHIIGWSRQVWWLIRNCRASKGAKEYARGYEDASVKEYNRGFRAGQKDLLLKTTRAMSRYTTPESTAELDVLMKELWS